jgi:hypothetical protein
MCRGCGRGAFFLGVGDLDKGLEGSGGHVETRCSSWTQTSVTWQTFIPWTCRIPMTGCNSSRDAGKRTVMAVLDAFLLGASAPSAPLFLFLSSWGAIVFDECECWMRLPKRPTIFGSPNFLQKRLRLLQFLDRPRVMRDGPCRPCHLSAVTCACGSRLPNKMKPCFLCRRAQQLRLQPVETRVTK